MTPGRPYSQASPGLRTRAGHAHVRECVERMAGYLLAVEFRHQSWFDTEANQQSTLDFERELSVVHVVVDGPQGFKNSVPTIWAKINEDLAILRLHGRNHATWDQKGLSAASDRSNYDYSGEELAGLTPAIIEMEKQVKGKRAANPS